MQSRQVLGKRARGQGTGLVIVGEVFSLPSPPLLPSSPRNQTACVLLLLTLFRVMALAADEFFSVILSQISQDLGLPPRLAGVTLLALGNGAPDLSASVAAVKSGNVE